MTNWFPSAGYDCVNQHSLGTCMSVFLNLSLKYITKKILLNKIELYNNR